MRKNSWFVLVMALACWVGKATGQAEKSAATLLVIKDTPARVPRAGLEPEVLDFRYSPSEWQVMINPPDDPSKSIVAWDGGLYYDIGKGGRYQSIVGSDYPWTTGGVGGGPGQKFRTRVLAKLYTEGGGGKIRQKLLNPRIPIVITAQDKGHLTLHQEAWAAPPREKTIEEWSLRRVDFLWLRMKNASTQKAKGRIAVLVGVAGQLQLNEEHTRLLRTDGPPFIAISPACESIEAGSISGEYEIVFPDLELAPGKAYEVLLGIYRGPQVSANVSVNEAEGEQQRAIKYWKEVDLPFDHINVPDAAVQALLDGSIRNLYQLRVIKEGLPVYMGGPSCYFDYWILDSALQIDAVMVLGRFDEARDAIRYMLTYRKKDGAIQQMKEHWKETGIALWIISQYARLSSDTAWLKEMWPTVQGAVGFIQHLRKMPQAGSLNEGLMPNGFSDGGIGFGKGEYSNIYWNLAGLKAAVEAARWLGKTEDTEKWQVAYEDFYATFRRAAERDTTVDAQGNRYVPTQMGDTKEAPPAAQYGFVNAVFPGGLFSSGDPLAQGNMAMLAATEREGIPFGVGFLKDGIWTIFGGFYAHALLWLGDGQKAAATFYAFGNHSCPLYAWVEEQSPIGVSPNTRADIPHQTANVEFIRLLRYLTIMERGKELCLLEGLPHAWTMPGSETRLRDIPTLFGPMSLTMTMSKDGSSAMLQVDPPRRERPEKIVVDLANLQRPVKAMALDGRRLTGARALISTGKSFKLILSF